MPDTLWRIRAVPHVQERLTAAFAAVRRKDFVGDGPWSIPTGGGCIKTPSTDPAFLYQDILVALCGEGPINPNTGEGPIHNGQPSLHALCLAHVNPQDSESVVHVGVGTGYYTAVLAMLVGAGATVVAYEIHPDLAARAGRNLSHLPNVNVRAVSEADDAPLPDADVIYVSAGATAPLDAWLNARKQGGRFVFPLTPAEGLGGMLLVTRHQSTDMFAAKFISPAMFIPCVGARDRNTGQKLTTAFQAGGTERVNSLYRDTPADDTCWFAGNGWWLSTRQID
jgi:protein-L-isoaspartate(D-aspartate) O-methyltransferase